MPLTVKAKGKEYRFNGPYMKTDDLKDDSGTYVVTTKASNGLHDILDVGESGKVRGRVENHDRADCWAREEKEGLFYSSYYCDEPTRMKVAGDIRAAHNPPCGER